MFVVIDFEATCTNTNLFPRNQMEIIEIGAVLCHNKNQINISYFQSFIRPVRNPILTNFCLNLTSIQQADVDSAPLFPEMMCKFQEWLYENKATQAIFCSWGAFDKNILLENCNHHQIEYPFTQHINLKKRFAQKQNCKPKGMLQALHQVKIQPKGAHHRGLDDAQNISKLLQFCF